MAVWLKVTLLLIYLAVLFLLARLIEVVNLYEHGQISRRLLDPMALSVLKLKALLEQRGVSYDGVVEKTELRELVEASGSVSEAESTTVTAVEEVTPVTNFTGHLNFYEQVEDAKDSMWLVEVKTDTGGLLADTSWNIIQEKVSKFGVRFGRFDCQLNMRMCARRQWFSPQLVLALPDTYKTKANVALYSFSGPIRVASLFDWIKIKVNEQIETINDSKKFQTQWLDYNSALDPEVRVIFISTLSSVPLFLSALSVKFPGRVKIGHIDTKTEKGKAITKKFNIKNANGYYIITKDKKYFYGNGRGETFTFRSFEFYLKSIYPNMNDLFICSMILTNVACFFEIVLTSGTSMRRFIKYILCMFKFNLLFMVGWILVLGIVQTGIFRSLCLISLKGLRIVTTSQGFSVILKDIQYFTWRYEIPLLVLVIMIFLAMRIKSKYFPETDNVQEDEESDWWNFSNLQTLDYSNWWETTRLRPFDQIFNPTAGIFAARGDSFFDFHEQVVSKEYIKYLPTWKYCSRKSEVRTDCKLTGNTVNQDQSLQCNEDKSGQDTPNVSCMSYHTFAPHVCQTPGNVANSLLDSNYSCECGHMCICTTENLTTNPTNPCSFTNDPLHTRTPPVAPEEPYLGEKQENPFSEFSKSYKSENLNPRTSRPSGYQDVRQCVICLDNFMEDVVLRGLPCHHVFHNTCILAWLMRENHFCPICRAPSNENKAPLPFENLHDD